MIHSYQDKSPVCAPTARAADNATVLGNVTLEAEANVWFGAVLRGDESSIHVGEGSNVQDNAVIHCDPTYPVSIGKDVTIGHGAIIHGCTIEDRCLIGMGAILLNGCVIGAGSLVAAGALVTQNAVVPPGSLVMGSPAKVTRPLRPEEAAENLHSAEIYRRLSAQELPPAAGG
ncbi:gamma carbonic anhydrase family protein [Intestinimonas massiliensis (ex Afouda et al. 2020)]|uniref:gamma carbonic anhydrase family protein n=1 Tax=Intestinimonas massiliensis (ex Afouda et al. 2020) TaxID=1673721 RepID=UPI00102FD40C|nr:gamma carbonic anhydrase family protein [Intestinimonas massiliensis (ex Afouda et al. 2020)]